MSVDTFTSLESWFMTLPPDVEEPVVLRATAHELAMMGLQSVRYHEDAEYRECVDAVLAIVPPGSALAVPAQGEDTKLAKVEDFMTHTGATLELFGEPGDFTAEVDIPECQNFQASGTSLSELVQKLATYGEAVRDSAMQGKG